jgi:nitrate/nitrite transport system permease protein
MNRLIRWLDLLNLTWFIPLVEMARGEPKAYHLKRLLRMVGLPVVAITLALLAWHGIARSVRIGGMVLPTPAVVWDRAGELFADWKGERHKQVDYEIQFAKDLAENPEMTEAELREYSPAPDKRITFVDNVITSLITVFAGFVLAMLIAVPLGICCGSSRAIYEMANPIIQVLKPVSPLAWFPVVFILVNASSGPAAATSPEPANAVMRGLSGIGDVVFWFTNQPKNFQIAALVVALCSIWPTLINTATGVANVERDYLNVAKVLNMGWFTRVRRIILPAALPAIFTGMRLSLGIAWMVLIAAEMMSVNPGLGMFIWNWYQSSNETALGYLLTAVIAIGIIGFVLDRLMISLQKAASRGNAAAIR